MKRYFITGTGTDIGKTFVTAGLAHAALAAGKKTAVVKPVQTGTDSYPTDLCEIRKMAPGIVEIPEEVATPYSFKLPASPHLAAAEEGKGIELSVMLDAVIRVELEFEPEIMLLEGAGGLLVPLNEKESMLDLMKLLDIPVIVVASSGLGTINHTLMTIDILKSAGVEIAGIIFNRMPLNPSVIEADNVQIIEKISGVRTLAVITELPKGEEFSSSAISELFDSALHQML